MGGFRRWGWEFRLEYSSSPVHNKFVFLSVFSVFGGQFGRQIKGGIMSELIYERESYLIMGACFAVYKEMGCGFLEPVYQECLEIEFTSSGIPFVPQKPLELSYRGTRLRHVYQPDFICFEKIIVELKAVSALCGEHRAQVINYLNASGFELGLLVNFGHHPLIESERLAHTRRKTAR